MKQMMCKLFCSIFLCFLCISACTSPQTSTVDPSTFFNITYIAIDYEALGGSTWYPVQGKFEVQFDVDSTGASGTWVMHYTSYLEPNLCPYGENCVCSGGLEGTFITTPTASPSPSSTSYDPNTPFTGDSSTPSPSPTSSSIDLIYSYSFDITITTQNLTSGCRPEANRTVVFDRFTDGTMIMVNSYRNQLLEPETLN
jgi:hypothetical protein